jgi:hypothetical protein
VNRRRVQFTATAREQLRATVVWWREQRHSTEALADEIEEAVELVAIPPGVGAADRSCPVDGVRRLYMRRVSYHVYYTYDDEVVTIRAVVTFELAA